MRPYIVFLVCVCVCAPARFPLELLASTVRFYVPVAAVCNNLIEWQRNTHTPSTCRRFRFCVFRIRSTRANRCLVFSISCELLANFSAFILSCFEIISLRLFGDLQFQQFDEYFLRSCFDFVGTLSIPTDGWSHSRSCPTLRPDMFLKGCHVLHILLQHFLFPLFFFFPFIFIFLFIIVVDAHAAQSRSHFTSLFRPTHTHTHSEFRHLSEPYIASLSFFFQKSIIINLRNRW